MKLTFERTGTCSWGMGNSCDEVGSFFVIDPDMTSIMDCGPIWKHHGMFRISNDETPHPGPLHQGKDYLFIPEQAYPLIGLMVTDIKKLEEKKRNILRARKQSESEEKNRQLEKIKSFIDISLPIEM